MQKNRTRQAQRREQQKAASNNKNSKLKARHEQTKVPAYFVATPEKPAPAESMPEPDPSPGPAVQMDEMRAIMDGFEFPFVLGQQVVAAPDTAPTVRGYHGESICGAIHSIDLPTKSG